MKINNTKYKLNKDNYFEEMTKKTQILFKNSGFEDMRHYLGWQNRRSGTYKKTTPYSINEKGNIFEHYEPKHFGYLSGNLDLDSRLIVITMSNPGWLEKNNEDMFITWYGDIYNKGVFEKRWRNHVYWADYTNKQMESAAELVGMLSKKFEITPNCIGHNTKVDGIEYFDGIAYRSNYFSERTDLSPAWDNEKFKNKIEKK